MLLELYCKACDVLPKQEGRDTCKHCGWCDVCGCDGELPQNIVKYRLCTGCYSDIPDLTKFHGSKVQKFMRSEDGRVLFIDFEDGQRLDISSPSFLRLDRIADLR